MTARMLIKEELLVDLGFESGTVGDVNYETGMVLLYPEFVAVVWNLADALISRRPPLRECAR